MSATFQIQLSKNCIQEQKYILDYIFTEIFGLDFEFQPDFLEDKIKISNTSSCIILSDHFFQKAEKNWLHIDSLPNSGLKETKINVLGKFTTISTFINVENNFEEKQNIDSTNQTIVIPFDLFGSLFFLLSRYEEAVIDEVDNHERFHSSSSITVKNGLITQAIGNEYIELLWECMDALWTLNRNKQEFQTMPSHDIDFPSFFWNKNTYVVIRKCLGDVVNRKDIKQAFGRFDNYLKFKSNKAFSDPFDNLDWIMKQSESRNLKSAFYYIPVKTNENDYGMPISHDIIIDQWKRILSRGHEIGYHPGYLTYNSKTAIERGAILIKQQLEKLNGSTDKIGGRQHVLRWKTPITARYLDDAGQSYDSTLGYADKAGFRCGFCYEYPMYDLLDRKVLKIRQRPLIAMDVTFNERYLNLNSEDTYNYIVDLKRECQKYNGNFTLLWHNTELFTNEQKELYTSILDA